MKAFVKFVLVFGITLLPFNKTFSQIEFSNLEDIWKYADRNNIKIQTSEVKNTIANKSTNQTYSKLFPSVNLNANFIDNVKISPTLIPSNILNPSAQDGEFSEVIFGRRYNYNANISAQINLLDLKDWRAIEYAKINQKITAINTVISKKEIYSQIANLYYSILLLKESEKLVFDNYIAASKTYLIAKNKFEEGIINETILNSAEINKEKADNELKKIEFNKKIQINNLKLILNSTDSIIISENFEINKTLKKEAILKDDPNVELLFLQSELAKNQLKYSKSDLYPVISAVYQLNNQIAADEFLQFENSNSIPQQFWGLKLSMPLFLGNNKRYQIQKMKLEYDLSQKEYEYIQKQNQVNNENLIIQYNNSLESLEKSKKILNLYKLNDIHAENKHNEGIISLEERLKSYSELINYQSEYIEIISNYFIQEYNILINQLNF